MANDKYRKAIFNAQVYVNSGAATYEKAVDMATKDMRQAEKYQRMEDTSLDDENQNKYAARAEEWKNKVQKGVFKDEKTMNFTNISSGSNELSKITENRIRNVPKDEYYVRRY